LKFFKLDEEIIVSIDLKQFFIINDSRYYHDIRFIKPRADMVKISFGEVPDEYRQNAIKAFRSIDHLIVRSNKKTIVDIIEKEIIDYIRGEQWPGLKVIDFSKMNDFYEHLYRLAKIITKKDIALFKDDNVTTITVDPYLERYRYNRIFLIP
jgi:hypothetical protein